jgi:uncharacterized protein (TIGR02466 family)
VIKEIFSTSIFIIKNELFLSETLCAFNSINIEEYNEPDFSGFTTFFNLEAENKIKVLIPNTLDFITTNSINYLNLIGYDVSKYKIYVDKIWINKMKENSNHNFHHHTQLGDKKIILSGTYYLKIPANSAPLLFSRSEGEFFNQANLPKLEENVFTRKFYEHQPSSGDLVLFLAETFHGIIGNKSIESRDTLSFNIMVEKNGNT